MPICSGGAIMISENANAQLKGCQFIENFAIYLGGNIFYYFVFLYF